MLEIIRNMARRKLRTGLTIFGIVIGIFALTVMGSMTEYFNTLIDNAVKQAGTNIGVSPKGGDFQSVLTPNDQKKIERVAGVRYVLPVVLDTLEELQAVNFQPNFVLGLTPETARLDLPSATLKRGRWLERGDQYQTVIGSTIATKRNLDLGGTITYHDHDFTVVGILNPTQTSPDTMVVIPLDVMRKLLKAPDLIMSLDIVPEDPSQVNALARRIQAAVDTVSVTTPEDAINQARQGLAIFNAILLGGAFMAVIVGGLAVVNTMIMSVSERTQEIGLKKAIGATDWDIIKEYVTEATLIGLFGGLVGLAFGAGSATLLNSTLSQALGGTDIFTVTPRLAVISLAFAIFLGAGAGLLPAWNAARLDPVKALRAK
jgi:putative ABC transport system permease protein